MLAVARRRARPAPRAGRGCAVHGLGAVVEDPAVRGEVAQPHHRAQRLARRAAGRRSSRTVSCGSSTATVSVPTSIASHSARSRWVSRRAAGGADPAAGAVGGGAAAVEGGGELPGDERAAVLDGERPGPVERARLVGEQPGLHLDPGGAQGRRLPRRRPGWGRAGRRPPGVRRPRSASAHGPVRPVWLHGSRVTTAVVPRAAAPACGQRVGLGVRRAGAAVEALGDRRRRRRRAARSRPAGWGRAARRAWRPARGRAHRRAARRRVAVIASPLRSGRGLRGCTAGRRAPRTWRRHRRLRALPIRTLTVGPGVPPGQPATGCGRVADFHRRFGISPPPEHASSRTRRPQSCHSRAPGPVSGRDRHVARRAASALARSARPSRRGRRRSRPPSRRRTRRRRPRRSARWSPARRRRRPGARSRRRACSISARVRRILGRHRSRNVWPPKPGSTVITSTMSSSGSRSS